MKQKKIGQNKPNLSWKTETRLHIPREGITKPNCLMEKKTEKEKQQKKAL